MKQSDDFDKAFVHNAHELPAGLHGIQRPLVAGFVWRETCPVCDGEGCCKCDQAGSVEILLSPAEAWKVMTK